MTNLRSITPYHQVSSYPCIFIRDGPVNVDVEGVGDILSPDTIKLHIIGFLNRSIIKSFSHFPPAVDLCIQYGRIPEPHILDAIKSFPHFPTYQ